MSRPSSMLVAREPAARLGAPAAGKRAAASERVLRSLFAVRQLPSDRASLHAYLVGGMPQAVIGRLLESLEALTPAQLALALGVSDRTLRRHQAAPDKPLPVALASRTWAFAETLALAVEVFGDRHAAESWLTEPALGLDGERPIELMQTQQGAELVNELLQRLAHGVYN